jgi:hypothetical protein
MKHVFKCRRTFIAVLGMICLTWLGLAVKAEVAGAIATIVLAVAGANASEKILKKKEDLIV